jgi:preprotein translocase subunit SecG
VIYVTILLIILLVISSLGVIATVLLQSGRSAGLSGAISGAGDTIFGKKKGMDELFTKMSTVFAALFLLTNLAMAIMHK